MLAGLIIEEASGQPYGEFLQERIFDPVGMSNTGYGEAGEALAVGYFSGMDALPNEPSVDYSAGGVYSTAEDLLRWDQALYSDTPLAAASRERMFTHYVPVEIFQELDVGYGYGWFVDDSRGYPLVSHGGAAAGFRSEMARCLDDHVTVIILSNEESATPGVMAERILRVVYGAEPGEFRVP